MSTAGAAGGARAAAPAPATTAATDAFELSALVVTTFRLNGAFLGAAEGLAKPSGLTAAWWQVLGAVLHEPLTVSGIAREMGLTRQSVQRIADLLADRGLAAYEPNPAHRRAKLLRATEAGLAAVRSIHDRYVPWAAAVTSGIDEARLLDALAVMRELAAAVDRVADPVGAAPPADGGR